jgi:integral membrane protein
VKNLLIAYRVLATVVGLSIITLLLVGVPLEHVHNVWPSVLPQGTTGQKLGTHIDMVLGTAHGFIYMGFLFVAFGLSRLAKWGIPFTVITLLCGTVPILSFWAEFRAIRKVKADFPELAGGHETSAAVR